MSILEIIVILCSVLIVGGVIGSYIYRRKKNLPTGECACCGKNSRKLVRRYHKRYSSKQK